MPHKIPNNLSWQCENTKKINKRAIYKSPNQSTSAHKIIGQFEASDSLATLYFATLFSLSFLSTSMYPFPLYKTGRYPMPFPNNLLDINCPRNSFWLNTWHIYFLLHFVWRKSGPVSQAALVRRGLGEWMTPKNGIIYMIALSNPLTHMMSIIKSVAIRVQNTSPPFLSSTPTRTPPHFKPSKPHAHAS